MQISKEAVDAAVTNEMKLEAAEKAIKIAKDRIAKNGPCEYQDDCIKKLEDYKTTLV